MLGRPVVTEDEGETAGTDANDEVGEAAQTASIDPDDDDDDGAVDGPRVSSFVDLARRIGKWKMLILCTSLIKNDSSHTDHHCPGCRTHASHLPSTTSSLSL